MMAMVMVMVMAMVMVMVMVIGCCSKTFSFYMSLGWGSAWAPSSTLRAGAPSEGHQRPIPTVEVHLPQRRVWGTDLGPPYRNDMLICTEHCHVSGQLAW